MSPIYHDQPTMLQQENDKLKNKSTKAKYYFGDKTFHDFIKK